ncbi:MAG: type II 3-dehydroquinate dehydratase [Clostridia bacterium]|nr:type II 3-dehydroquinate dehydratase [Clostridia bacterium]
MKILVINGPNINMLGIREPDIYGKETFADVIEKIKKHAEQRGVEVGFFQSNHEGALVDEIQAAYQVYDGIVINPGAYTHTSIAIADAISAVAIPTVEIHISDVDKREAFRHISYIRPLCVGCIKGHGTDGYLEAIDLLMARGESK